MSKELIITIAGKSASGKSHLAYLLKKFLREQEFDVELVVNQDYLSETEFDRQMCENNDNAINSIKKNTLITLIETQIVGDFKN